MHVVGKFCLPAITSTFKSFFRLNSFSFWSFRDSKGRKMALTSLNVYTTSHLLRQTSFYILCHGLPVKILEAAVPLGRWKVSLRWLSMGCCQIQTTQCNSLDLILMRLWCWCKSKDSSIGIHWKYNRAISWQNQQNECAPSKDFDQPGHPPSLISVFAVRLMGS